MEPVLLYRNPTDTDPSLKLPGSHLHRTRGTLEDSLDLPRSLLKVQFRSWDGFGSVPPVSRPSSMVHPSRRRPVYTGVCPTSGSAVPDLFTPGSTSPAGTETSVRTEVSTQVYGSTLRTSACSRPQSYTPTHCDESYPEPKTSGPETGDPWVFSTVSG